MVLLLLSWGGIAHYFMICYSISADLEENVLILLKKALIVVSEEPPPCLHIGELRCATA